MSDFFVNNIYTIILFPLWVFLLIIFGKFFAIFQSKRLTATLTILSTLYGFVFSVMTFLTMYKTPDFVYENSYNFIQIQDYLLKFGIYIDNLSTIMLLVVTSVSLLVQIYSSVYMKEDKSFPRFFAYLNLFNFSMLGLVLSSNLFQTYVFWELVGVSSYLLIGFWYKKQSASLAAKKAFIMNRIGDFGLLAGTIIISCLMYQYANVAALATVPFANIYDIGSYLYSFTNEYVFVGICILLLFGAIAKSAQFPLHTWLPDAMEGPTPVSALIHSATMVAAGVYLVARLYPIFSLSDFVMHFIAIIGLITALICAYFAITQNDLKRILAFSTNSQLGLMFLALGCGVFSGGLFHLVTHAYFKSMLFLCSGIVIHSLFELQDIRFMGGLRKHMPVCAISYLIGCITISGVFFSGFFSKEMILSGLFDMNKIFYATGFLLVAFMTAFYMFRSYFLVFECECKSGRTPHKPHWVLNFSVGTLAIITVLLGFIVHHEFASFITYGNEMKRNIHSFNPLYLSLFVSGLGIVLAYICYNTKFSCKKIPILYNLSFNKLYIDDLYSFITDKIYRIISRLCALFDRFIVDGVVVLTSYTVKGFSWVFSKMQTSNLQSYLTYSLAFIAFIFFLLMFAYTIFITPGLGGY